MTIVKQSALDITERYRPTIRRFPKKTLDYFAVSYANYTYQDAHNASANTLIDTLCRSSKASMILQIYEDTEHQIASKAFRYDYYVEMNDSGEKKPVTHHDIIEQLDEHYLFGKAIFIHFLDSGTMDVPGAMFHAEKKRFL